MDTLDVARVCLRRWYLFLPVFLLAAGIGLNIKMTTPPMWVASGKLTVLYKQQHISASGQGSLLALNPLGANNGVQLQAALIADLNSADQQKALGSPETTAAVPGSTASGSFMVQQDDNSQLITVAAGSTDPKTASDVVTRVMSQAANRINLIQKRAGAPADSMMYTFVAVPTELGEHTSSGTKLLLATSGTGALLGAALSIIGDRLLRGRTARRAARRRTRSQNRRQESATRVSSDPDAAPASMSDVDRAAEVGEDVLEVHRHKAPSM